MSEARAKRGGSGGRSAPGQRSEGQIEGRRPVLEALRAGRDISELLVASGSHASAALAEIAALAQRQRIPVRQLPRREIEARAETRNPQGVIALTRTFGYSTLDELLDTALSSDDPALLVALDGVTDPQNLGALARSAEAAGASGLIVPKRRAAGVTTAAERAASGAFEYLRVALVTNLTRAIETLKQRGVWVIGLDATGERAIYDADLTGPLCVVVGAEGTGLSRLVRERVDDVLTIPMRGRVASLNAAAAGAIALFEIRRQQL